MEISRDNRSFVEMGEEKMTDDINAEKINTEKVSATQMSTEKINTKKLNIKFHVLAIFYILLFCFALTPVTFQNDTYYTIAIGKHIVETGTIDMQDPFSWHEDLPYTYPHWAYDVGTYLVYQLGENIGI